MELNRLTNSECEVMKILWEADHDLTLQEILPIAEELFSKKWKRQTVATFLSHLIKKGIIESYRIGRYFYYRVIIPMEVYKEYVTADLIDFWYNGSSSDLLASLYHNDTISEEDFREGLEGLEKGSES